MKLYCKNCNLLLVEGLQEVLKKDVNYTDGFDLIPKNKYIINNDIWNFYDLEINYLININSIKLRNHSNSYRMQGCCGPSGMDGYNQVCPNCKIELGIKVADCFTPHFVGIDIKRVSLKPLW